MRTKSCGVVVSLLRPTFYGNFRGFCRFSLVSLPVAFQFFGVSFQKATCQRRKRKSTMVCESCQTKVTKLAVPDKWKDGARNSVGSTGSSASGGSKALKTNKALIGKFKVETTSQHKICRICKSKTQPPHNFCNDCSHKKGLCSMCGKKVVDTSKHNMSLV